MLFTLPRDEKGIEELIRKHGEGLTALAWFEFVIANPPLYHMQAVTLAVKKVSKAGNTYLEEREDESVVTKFPVASFLSGNIATDCLDQARARLARVKDTYFFFPGSCVYLIEMAMKGL
jgi:hypothetical protein